MAIPGARCVVPNYNVQRLPLFLPPNTNSEANAFPHTVVHRNAPPDRNAPLPPCNALSISVDIVARCRASSPPSKKREECRRILESSTRAFESFKLTKLLPLFLRCYVISSSSSFSSSFFFRCFLFFFLLSGKRSGNDRLSNSLTNCSREKVRRGSGGKLVGEASKLISGKSGGVVSGDW